MSLLRNEKWLRDSRGKKLARATGPQFLNRPADLWLETLSFMTPRRRVAYEARYDLGQRDWFENKLNELQPGDVDPDKLVKKFTKFAKER